MAGAGHIPKGTIMIDVIIALEAELAGRRLPPGFRVTFCGVGKINAALATAIDAGGASSKPQIPDRGKVIKISNKQL